MPDPYCGSSSRPSPWHGRDLEGDGQRKADRPHAHQEPDSRPDEAIDAAQPGRASDPRRHFHPGLRHGQPGMGLRLGRVSTRGRSGDRSGVCLGGRAEGWRRGGAVIMDSQSVVGGRRQTTNYDGPPHYLDGGAAGFPRNAGLGNCTLDLSVTCWSQSW